MAFIDQSEFEVMKTLSSWEAVRSYRSLNKSRNKKERNKERIRKMALLLSHTFVFVFRVAFGHLYSPNDIHNGNCVTVFGAEMPY